MGTRRIAESEQKTLGLLDFFNADGGRHSWTYRYGMDKGGVVKNTLWLVWVSGFGCQVSDKKLIADSS